ncbi:S-layer homology domain-containing protein [Parageobacillus thermoglucosidasius]|uniref:S-layer protein n=2 Tax=Parageobacillus TaxID=1906945 RepID=A0A1B7KQ00_PARTM|nr:S-layer homology domain-containing protein [Parageobacillus thermoglucosidasius]OAT72174.1 S-layer protein [Parageobacillus thermoglucosidasius]
MRKFYGFVLIFALIIALFTPKAEAASKLKDVTNDYWAKKEIEFLSSKGIIKGYNDGTFKPDEPVKRVQAAVMITRALGLNTSNRPNPGFKDIKNLDKEAYNAIAAVVDEGIFPKGQTFRPYAALSRADMAIALVKAYNLKGTYSGKITDVSGMLYSYVSALAANGITKIYDDGTFKPNNTVTRAHFSVFFARVLDPSFRVPVNSKERPAKLGETLVVETDDWLNGYHKYEMELTDVITDGKLAWDMIREANIFNDEPPIGKKYILAKFRFKLLEFEGKTFSTYDINSAKFEAVSSKGVVYENPIVIEPEPKLSANVYKGGEVEGWVAFLVDEDDTPLIVWQRDWEDELWFSLE